MSSSGNYNHYRRVATKTDYGIHNGIKVNGNGIKVDGTVKKNAVREEFEFVHFAIRYFFYLHLSSKKLSIDPRILFLRIRTCHLLIAKYTSR